MSLKLLQKTLITLSVGALALSSTTFAANLTAQEKKEINEAKQQAEQNEAKAKAYIKYKISTSEDENAANKADSDNS